MHWKRWCPTSVWRSGCSGSGWAGGSNEARPTGFALARASRRVAGRRKIGTASRAGSGQTAAIREWAEAQGINVDSRRRISADIVERYNNR